MPFSLGATHNFIFVLDQVFCTLGLFISLLDFFVLQLLELNLTNNGVKNITDVIVSNLDQLLRDGIWQQLLAKFTDEFLYLFTLLIVAEGHSLAIGAGSSRAPNSMQVALRLRWEAKVEHCFNS